MQQRQSSKMLVEHRMMQQRMRGTPSSHLQEKIPLQKLSSRLSSNLLRSKQQQQQQQQHLLWSRIRLHLRNPCRLHHPVINRFL
jgi:hypothetical protein